MEAIKFNTARVGGGHHVAGVGGEVKERVLENLLRLVAGGERLFQVGVHLADIQAGEDVAAVVAGEVEAEAALAARAKKTAARAAKDKAIDAKAKKRLGYK